MIFSLNKPEDGYDPFFLKLYKSFIREKCIDDQPCDLAITDDD